MRNLLAGALGALIIAGMAQYGTIAYKKYSSAMEQLELQEAQISVITEVLKLLLDLGEEESSTQDI